MKSLMYGLMGAAIAPMLVTVSANAATLESSPSERETIGSAGMVEPIPAPALPNAAYAVIGITGIALIAGRRKLPEYELEPIRVKSK